MTTQTDHSVIAEMLNPLRIIKNSSKLTIVGMVGTALNIPASIVVAKLLGPDLLGQVSFVTLWLTYASLIHPGILEGGVREVIDHLGRREMDKVLQYQNLAFTGELVWGIFPAFALVLASYLFREPIRQRGLIIVAVTFIAMAINRALANFHLARQRFALYARFNLVRAVLLPLSLIVLVLWIGPYGMFIAPAAIEWLVTGLYVFNAPKLHLSAELNWGEALRLTGIGLPLAIQGFVYWGYRLTGITSVATWLTVRDLAFYAFSANLISYALRAFNDFAAVLTPALWTEIGRAGTVRNLNRETMKISLFVMVASCGVANLAQASIGPIVRLLVPKFEPSVGVFEILSFNIVVLTMTLVPSLILDSAAVNKQWLHLSVWVMALAVNFALNYLVIQLGWGLMAVAWNDVWIQLGVVVTLYLVARRYMFERVADALSLYKWQASLALLCAVTFILLRSAPFAMVADGSLGLLIGLVARAGTVALTWVVIGSVVYFMFFRRNTVLQVA